MYVDTSKYSLEQVNKAFGVSEVISFRMYCKFHFIKVQLFVIRSAYFFLPFFGLYTLFNFILSFV